MTVINGPSFLSATSKVTFASLLCNTTPMVIVCIYTIYKAQKQYDQTFFCALDTLILGFLAGILLIVDSINNSNNQFYGIF
jgi:RsiW-degrading membrane proteinase PrsW (M82 family)